jgi:Flp pilus assembly pilin Flp
MANTIRIFVRCDHAATAVEYALMASIICLAIITGLTNIGGRLSVYFSEASSALK